MAIDYSAFQKYLQYAASDVPGALITGGGGEYEPAYSYYSADYMADPSALFDIGVNTGNRRSLNPYYLPQIRDAMRDVAQKLGLTTGDADIAALTFAQNQLGQQGHGYTDATSPTIVADEIAKQLFSQAGRTYQGLTPEERQQYIGKATEFQNAHKETDPDAWKRTDFGGIAGVFMEQIQQAWEKGTNGGLPSEQALAGADNPFNTWLQNQLHNEDWDPIGNEYGLATDETYKTAADQGYDIGAAQLLNRTAQQAIGAAAAPIIGGAVEQFGGIGAEAAGVDPAYIEYAGDAKTASDYYKQYEKYKAGGELNPGAVFSAASGASSQIKIGDFDSSAFSGGDSPYNSNSFFDETTFGSNFAGGTVYDESGNWLDGEYDQYGNFVPSDQTSFGDDYGAGYGQGNDIFGGGNLEQSNPELFGGGSGGLPNLGSLFSGLGSGIGGLLGGGKDGGGSLLALAPILAAIQYARNQGPFDTSRLTALSDKYNPDAMAYNFDRNTEDQRRSLTSSLTDRGVMGSSFGNMDITNFNTNRELGRGALISQASLGGADIADKILKAQIQERALKNQMYGSALYSLGNVFGGRKA